MLNRKSAECYTLYEWAKAIEKQRKVESSHNRIISLSDSVWFLSCDSFGVADANQKFNDMIGMCSNANESLASSGHDAHVIGVVHVLFYSILANREQLLFMLCGIRVYVYVYVWVPRSCPLYVFVKIRWQTICICKCANNLNHFEFLKKTKSNVLL